MELIFGIIPFLNIQKKYDIIHCHFGPSGLFAVFLQSLGVLDGRIITTFHGYDVNLNYLNRSVYRELFDKGDKFIAVSKYIASKLLALGCKSEKLIIIPNGVDLDFYTPSKRENSEGVIRILSIGRLVEKKGFIFGLKAIKDLLNLHLNIEYNIIGNGVLFNSFEKFIQDHKLEKHIHLIGALNKDSTLKFYQNSDIFLMPYITADNGDSEGQGLVLQEAQAMELPVISTFHNGVQEGVLNMKTGFLVEEKDINSLLEKLEILILNEKLRKKMGKAGREYVINNFNQKLFNQKLKQEYQRTLKR
ncbi:MAG: glycosyltransferase [Fulvivirga sp.]|uniref:glycosyltransferase n=1 Tax=Fulvivirga sp. TaxID=1931237 RepID=UPI0032EF5768